MKSLTSPFAHDSGKSTLLKVLLCLVETEGGQVLVDGTDISSITRRTIRRHFSTIQQELYIMDLSVANNVDVFGTSDSSAISDALEKVGLLQSIGQSGGIDCQVSNLFLSRGQRQLLCFAHALLNPAKILLLYEVTSRWGALLSHMAPWIDILMYLVQLVLIQQQKVSSRIWSRPTLKTEL